MSDYETKLEEIRKAIEERRAANEALHAQAPAAIANSIAVRKDDLEAQRAAAEQAHDAPRIEKLEGDLAKLPADKTNQLEYEDIRYKVESAAVKRAENRLDGMVQVHLAEERELREKFQSGNQEPIPQEKFDQKEMNEKKEILRDRIIGYGEMAAQALDPVADHFGLPKPGGIADAIPPEVKESAVDGVLRTGEHVQAMGSTAVGRAAEVFVKSTDEEIEAGVQKAVGKDKADEARQNDPAGVQDRARLDADQKHHRDQGDELTALQSSGEFKNQSFEEKSQQLKDLFQKQDHDTQKSYAENRVHHEDLKAHQDRLRDDMQSDKDRQRYQATRDVCREEAEKLLDKGREKNQDQAREGARAQNDAAKEPADVRATTNAFQEQTFPEVYRANKAQHDQRVERQSEKFEKQLEQLKAKQTEELTSPRTGPNRDDPTRNRNDPDWDR